MTEQIPQAQPPPALRTKRLWRLRHSPLRRRIDRVRTWAGVAVTAAVLITAPAAMLLAGRTTEHSLRDTAHDQAQSRHRSTAALLYDTPHHLEPGSDEAKHTRYMAKVRFTDADGRTRTGDAEVPPGLPAGATVTVWSNEHGDLTDPPMTDGQIRSRALGWAATAGITVALAGAAVHAAIGLVLKRRSLAGWDKAWADTAPRWTVS